MRREIRDALEIIAWGLIGFSILIINSLPRISTREFISWFSFWIRFTKS
jgi:hypothetical protein